MAETGLAAWAGRQPAWTQDALWRIAAESGFELSEEAIGDVRERVMHEAGGGQEAGPACTPFDPGPKATTQRSVWAGTSRSSRLRPSVVVSPDTPAPMMRTGGVWGASRAASCRGKLSSGLRP